MKKALIIDIDSTVANCDHRIHHIKDGNRDWNAFFAGIPHDTVIEHTVEIVDGWYKSGKGIVIALTGRPEQYRAVTQKWVDENLPFPVERLFMRAENDYRPGPVTKVATLEQIRAEGYDPIAAFDDHGGIIKAFRAAGLPCYHVADSEDDIPRKVWQGNHCLTMVIGPVAAGKSTLVEQFPASWVVSSDEYRELLTPWRRNDPNNEEVWKSIPNVVHSNVWRAIHSVIEARLNAGLPTVVDATNIKAADRKSIVDLVPKGQAVQYLIVDRPLDEKIQSRGWRPETLVRRMHESFQSSVKHALTGDGYDFVTVVDLRSNSLIDRAKFAKDLALQWLTSKTSTPQSAF